MTSVRLGLIAMAVSLLTTSPVAAQAPVALVEDVQGKPDGVDFMDYVTMGHVIKLGPQDTIVLGYLKSCWRETITGATVTVGFEQSRVQGGNVNREKVACDAGRMQLTAQTASKGGAMVFREAPSPTRPSPLSLRPQFILYGTAPVVMMATGSPVQIERLDRPGERFQISADFAPRGSLYDFADHNQSLAAGGVYRATQGATRVTFQVSFDAKPGKTPLLGRLVQLKSSS
jgi:hypothetical protein